MPFLVSDRAVFCRNVTVCDDDMWPNFARSHSTIACGLLELHGAPGFGEGFGDGPGAGAAGVRNVCVMLQPLAVSPSLARTRQKSDEPFGRGELLKVVWPAPSFTMPAALSCVNAWSVAIWNSYPRKPTGPTIAALAARRVGDVVAICSLLTGETGEGAATDARGKMSKPAEAAVPVLAPSSAHARQK